METVSGRQLGQDGDIRTERGDVLQPLRLFVRDNGDSPEPSGFPQRAQGGDDPHVVSDVDDEPQGMGRPLILCQGIGAAVRTHGASPQACARPALPGHARRNPCP